MNIVENDSRRFFLFLQLVIFGLLNLITFKKFENLNSKIAKLMEELKNMKI